MYFHLMQPRQSKPLSFRHWQVHNVIISAWLNGKDSYRDRHVSVYLNNCKEQKQTTETVEPVISYSFFTVIEVNRHRCISVGILSMNAVEFSWA